MTFASEMEEDITEIAADLPATLVAAGVSVAGTASPHSRSDEVTDDRDQQQHDVDFVAARSLFTGGIPEVRDPVTLTCAGLSITSVRYYVRARIDDSGGVSLQLARVA